MSGPHILVVGGGYVGMYTAQHLKRKPHHVGSVASLGLGSLQDPQRGFREVAGPAPSPEAVVPPSER